MLISTNLIFETKSILCMVNHWYLFPLQSPFQISFCFKLKSYRFATNLSFLNCHWIHQCILLILSFLFGAYRAKTESKSTFDPITVMFFLCFGVFYTATVYFQKIEAKNFIDFLNQILFFEKHNSISTNLTEQHYWKNNSSNKLVTWITKIGTVSLFSHTILYSLSCTYNPAVPWSIMPSSFLNVFCGGSVFNIIGRIFSRLILLIYSYITMKLMVNLAATIDLLSILIPTFCISACLISLHPKLNQAKSKKGFFTKFKNV